MKKWKKLNRPGPKYLGFSSSFYYVDEPAAITSGFALQYQMELQKKKPLEQIIREDSMVLGAFTEFHKYSQDGSITIRNESAEPMFLLKGDGAMPSVYCRKKEQKFAYLLMSQYEGVSSGRKDAEYVEFEPPVYNPRLPIPVGGYGIWGPGDGEEDEDEERRSEDEDGRGTSDDETGQAPEPLLPKPEHKKEERRSYDEMLARGG